MNKLLIGGGLLAAAYWASTTKAFRDWQDKMFDEGPVSDEGTVYKVEVTAPAAPEQVASELGPGPGTAPAPVYLGYYQI